jgi:hypothetical protein
VAGCADLWQSDKAIPNQNSGWFSIMLTIIDYLLAFLGWELQVGAQGSAAYFVVDNRIRRAAKGLKLLFVSPGESAIAVTPHRAFDGMVISRA